MAHGSPPEPIGPLHWMNAKHRLLDFLPLQHGRALLSVECDLWIDAYRQSASLDSEVPHLGRAVGKLRATVDRSGINYDHPDALETPLLVEHLCGIGRSRTVRLYDHG